MRTGENFLGGEGGAKLKLPEKIRWLFGQRLTSCCFVFTYFRIRNKMSLWFKNKTMKKKTMSQSHFCVKRLVLIGILLLKKYTVVNGLIRTI